ncbi:laminin subunit alpha-like isoform X2 [Mercenaria mercenaria]|uniref:laminin subunit alpha-like isoform X2 n=1 Tax=Mercenaria mercenaria TaxID=6596 RepID=UPI00234F1B3B|nr:laminin subunit alpha-like isoform X2 [Mercenaria mercenaria]
MAEGVHLCFIFTLLCSNVILLCNSQVLTPPTFNLAKGRHISASATCGYGVATKELYCRLTGSSGDDDADTEIMIQGQLCDYCDPTDPSKNHSADNAIDGTNKFWQSPPLSRGEEFNEVDLDIELEQDFHIAYIFIKMANSPRPGVWALEKSTDFGETWEPWQYFADNEYDCERFFNTKAGNIATRDNQVLCVTDFSRIVPLNDGEILVSLTNNRPNFHNFSHADDLQEFMRATNVRLRLIRTNTLKGQLMAKVNQDQTVTRRYFYSIKDISIGGRCLCHGHADTCNYLDLNRPNRLVCDCQHNTVGDQCELCDAANGFVQKKWQPRRVNSAFECEPCQCYGRATECVYDPDIDAQGLSIDIHGFYNGGGVCQNCGFNSTGINCEKCLPGYYRPFGMPPTELFMCERCQCDLRYHLDECEEETGRCLCREEYTGYNCDACAVGYYGYPDCIPCDCDVNGTVGDVCHVGGGQCPCKENFVGKKCDMCQIGFYDFPTCGPCECDMIGSVDDFCNVDSGQCNCAMNYGSRNCSQCANGYFNFPDCTLCSCDPVGTIVEVCDKTNGMCLCMEKFDGERCDRCARGFYAYPDCMSCQCQEPGSTSNICEDRTGQCTCRGNYAGQNCERCAPGFYKYPECIACDCDIYGSYGQSCDQETGQCDCRYNFQGLQCEKCKEGLYNYPNCEECNCNPAGAKEVPGYPLGGCGEVITGRLCECKERVIGRICDTCKPSYWNLNRNNLLGCEECGCSDAGSIAGLNMCNMITGQCMCKVYVSGRSCDRCRDGYYGLHKQNLYGCDECNCDIGGSVTPYCDKETGQCPCKPRVQGRRCDMPIRQHFIPTLDQMKYELEDGYTPEGTQVRYGYDERIFPNFSWRGYAILMNVQPEVRMDVNINKPSLYRLVYRYVNRNEESVKGEVTLDPESIYEISQTSEVNFAPSMDPTFADVGNSGGLSSFVLNPGKWSVGIKTDESVFLDYMILIPQAYYEATVLQNTVYRPCLTPDDAGPCIHYRYPNVLDLPRVLGETGYIIDNGQKVSVQLFVNQDILDELDVNSMAVLDPSQNKFNLDLNIPKEDKYVLVLNYYSNANGTQTLLFNIGDKELATAVLYNCEYSSLCRQVLLGLDEMEGVFHLEEGNINITVTGDDEVNAAIESVIAIPYSTWSIGYIRPSIVCIRVNGVCVGSHHATPVGSVRIDFETLPNDHLLAEVYPPGIDDSEVGLVRLNDTMSLIVLLGTARSPGQHKFVVHYYLPYDIGQDIPIKLLANGQEYRGTFKPRYCPGIHGCRDLIYFDETGVTGNMNLVDTEVQVVFNNTSGQQIWLDYLLLIPSSQYSPQDVMILPVDNSRNFIDSCLDEGFMVKVPVSDFCEKSLFTLTTEFNNGALECECDIDGSMSFHCDPYGGQCQCRPNVIGRTCSACKVGYFGFPRCQPCNCPFGLCHQLTGQCICPPRVTGDRCDVCKPGTYGYDALIGCQECQCNPQGVVDGDMNCHEDTGHCSCLPGIGGRKCDYCLAGFYAFPACRECDCDRYGTTEEICNPDTAYCLCKENVVGSRCDQCEAFTYHLEPTNPLGCTNCFCFGNTANCRESTLRWDLLVDMNGWGVTNTVDGEVRDAGEIIAILDAEDKIDNTNVSMYWTAPDSYLGNKVRSYGGFLHYQVLFVLPRNDSIVTEALIEPDLILVGNNNVSIVHHSVKQPYDSSMTTMEIQLYEYNFEHPGTGLKVDRDTFMMILVNLEAMHIRASYYSVVNEIRLTAVELDIAAETGFGEYAASVEECACPRGYTGTSCESCVKGYYRARHYPFLGVCVPCDCNGHTDTCDVNTGECLGCGNNTVGAHCESCRLGYYGEPTRGGACYICGCPLNVESNNFADQCSVTSTGIVARCDCYEGYTGDRCERCAPGYFGDPRVEGDTCEMCQCSGNIDMRDPGSCDYQTGDCLQCINNSTGPRCERCLDWWYGDAVDAKDCFPCSCDRCGSLSCSSHGECVCKPNVIGFNCSTCAPDTYGFDQCDGCIPCECAEASASTQCDFNDGSCLCQPGVTGHKCQSCISGYWNYGENGCQRCDCEFDGAVTCDPIDGRCQCLPGVTGTMCEQCLDRWVLIPQEGCRECDTCTHNLLDDMEVLDADITDVQSGLQTVSIGVEAMRRLDVVNQTIEALGPQVISVLYESENITLDPVENELKQVEVIVNNVHTRSRGSLTDADDLMEEGKMLVDNSVEAEKLGEISQDDARDAILNMNEVLNQINEGIKVTNIETYISMSEQFIEEIRARNFTGQNDSVEQEMDDAEALLALIKEKQMEPKEQMMFKDKVADSIKDVNNRLADLLDNSQNSESVSTRAQNLIDKLRDDTISSIVMHIEDIEFAEQMTLDTIMMSNDQLNASEVNVDTAAEEFRAVDKVSSQLLQAKAAVEQFNLEYENLDLAEASVNDSFEHADSLLEQAMLLENVYTDTREVAANAVTAGTAYENIVKAISNAKLAADMAMQAADEAALNSQGVGDESQNLTSSSGTLLLGARIRYNDTQIDLLERLDIAKAGTNNIEDMNKDVRNEVDQINTRIGRTPVGEAGDKANEVVVKGGEAEVKAADSKDSVKDILGDLPKQLEKTVPLTNDALNTNRDIKEANVQVKNVEKFIPEIKTLLKDLTAQSEKVMNMKSDVTTNIAALRKKIDIARDQANLIRVGLNFLGNTSVTLRNPPNVAQAGSYSQVDLFFKTNSENGLLLYAGSKRSATNKGNQGDYMSLEIENGNVVFKYDLGSGEAKINHPHYVADGQWYKVIAKRIGKGGILTLERDPDKEPLGSVQGRSEGLATVLEMNPLTTRFYAGGLPDGATISDKVTRENYVGAMESIQFLKQTIFCIL